jgi:hypothetical protein
MIHGIRDLKHVYDGNATTTAKTNFFKQIIAKKSCCVLSTACVYELSSV